MSASPMCDGLDFNLRKSSTTSPSTGLGGGNESIGGSCFLLIIMLDIHLLLVYYRSLVYLKFLDS